MLFFFFCSQSTFETLISVLSVRGRVPFLSNQAWERNETCSPPHKKAPASEKDHDLFSIEHGMHPHRGFPLPQTAAGVVFFEQPHNILFHILLLTVPFLGCPLHVFTQIGCHGPLSNIHIMPLSQTPFPFLLGR